MQSHACFSEAPKTVLQMLSDALLKNNVVLFISFSAKLGNKYYRVTNKIHSMI